MALRLPESIPLFAGGLFTAAFAGMYLFRALRLKSKRGKASDRDPLGVCDELARSLGQGGTPTPRTEAEVLCLQGSWRSAAAAPRGSRT